MRSRVENLAWQRFWKLSVGKAGFAPENPSIPTFIARTRTHALE